MSEAITRDSRSAGAAATASAAAHAILREAAQLATVEGLDGLSIGRLADAVGMSKSGLFAHFGSKEELQLATIETASEIFDERRHRAGAARADRARAAAALCRALPRARRARGLPRRLLLRLGRGRAGHPPGPGARPRIAGPSPSGSGCSRRPSRDAQAEGAVDPAEDPAQLAFELNAYLLLANAQFVVSRRERADDRARAGARPPAATSGSVSVAQLDSTWRGSQPSPRRYVVEAQNVDHSRGSSRARRDRRGNPRRRSSAHPDLPGTRSDEKPARSPSQRLRERAGRRGGRDAARTRKGAAAVWNFRGALDREGRHRMHAARGAARGRFGRRSPPSASSGDKVARDPRTPGTARRRLTGSSSRAARQHRQLARGR